MKDNNEKKIGKIMILLIIMVVIFIITVILSVITYDENNLEEDTVKNNYIISEKVVEMPGTKIITNDNMKAEHCLNDICLTNTTFYNNDKVGRVECMIINKTSEVKSGYLKLLVDGKSLVLSYSELEPQKEELVTIRYKGADFSSVEDFTLSKLSRQEIKAIKDNK